MQSMSSWQDEVELESIVMGLLGRYTQEQIEELMVSHGLGNMEEERTAAEMRRMVCNHVCTGECKRSKGPSCVLYNEKRSAAEEGVESREHEACFLRAALLRSGLRALRRLLDSRCVLFNYQDTTRELRKKANAYIRRLTKGKRDEKHCHYELVEDVDINDGTGESEKNCENAWPRRLSDLEKEDLVRAFRSETGKEALSSIECGSCFERVFVKTVKMLSTREIEWSIFRCDEDLKAFSPRLTETLAPDASFHGLPKDVFVHLRALVVEEGKLVGLRVCSICAPAVQAGKRPALSTANRMYLRLVPTELQDLTFIEEVVIARCRAKACIIQLREDGSGLANKQRGMKGHIIIYPQQPERLVSMLPCSVGETITPICILFVGSHPPSREWLWEHVKPLIVR